jgi:hypothetical protein
LKISFDIYSAEGDDIIAAFLKKDKDSPKQSGRMLQ